MKKSACKKKILAAGIMFLILSPQVFAECDYETNVKLSGAANSVEAKYEIVNKIVDYGGIEHPEISDEVADTFESGYVHMDTVNIRILNITDDIYVTVTSPDDSINAIVTKADLTNGIYTYQVPDFDEIRTYNIKVYSNNDSCKNQELRNIELLTPKYNPYSATAYCANEKIANTYNCQQYITTEVAISDEYLQGIGKTTIAQNISNFWSKYGSVLISGIIVIVLLVAGVIAFFAHRKKKETI